MQPNHEWYKRRSVVILLLVLFFPAGLFLMWRFTNWNKKIKLTVTAIFVLFLLMGFVNDNFSSKKSGSRDAIQPYRSSQSKTVSAPKPTKHELDAKVKFNEEAFMVTNNENLDWTDCKLELNSGILSGGYTFNGTLKSKDALIIPFREFTKGDGTRFNSSGIKPKNLSISCKVGEERGFNYFALE